MLVISRENHLAVFDSRNFYVASFTFQLTLPESKSKTESKQQPRNEPEEPEVKLKDQYAISFHVENKFTYEWHSEFYDLEVEANEINQFGSIPFSLETFLEIYRNPKHWKIVLRQRNEEADPALVMKSTLGKLVIKTHFTSNPFIVPIQVLTQSLQADKTFKVITQEIPEQRVISSAEFVEMEVTEVDEHTFVTGANQVRPLGFRVYTFRASDKICGENICFIKGVFEMKEFEHKGRKIFIYSAGKPVAFIPNLQKIMVMLKFIDNDIIIFQNVDTNIEDSYRLVFFTDLSSLYAKIFRSYLYSKIFDRWIIEGMVHYNRDNRHFQDILQELTDLLTEGEEFFPLSNGDYCFDYVWKVKAKFIYHVLANLFDSDLTQRIIMEFSNKKKKKLTSALIFKKMKNNIGKDKMKTIYEHQFINCTGINRIFYDMDHEPKERKIKITLRQRSLVCGVFRRYNRIRIKLEESYRLVSPLMEKIIRKNEGKRNDMSGPLAVPKLLKCLPYFVGPVSIEIENSEPFEEQLQEQNILQKIIDAKQNLRARRTTNKKSDQGSSEVISWMMMDTSVTFPAVYKGKNLSEGVIEGLVKKTYQNQIEELKVLNSISIKEHSESLSICKLLIEKIKIKPNKQNSKISVKRKILQLLPNFIAKADDITVWDEILELLKLYEPVCYDYSEEGNLFLLSLIESIGNIHYTLKFNLYFEEFHRIILAISRYHQYISEEKFQVLHKQIFKSIMKWTSKYSFQILGEARNYLDLTLADPRLYLGLNKIIIENVLPYIDMLKIKDGSLKVVHEIYNLTDKHMEMDTSGVIKSVLFHYRTKINERNLSPLQFLNSAFTQLEDIKLKHFHSYDKCLQKFKQILNKNRERYALEIQIEKLNENQNYFLAEYLWKNLCSPESLHNARIRLAWMKIYRIFYFYFTPIVTMVKLNKNQLTQQFKLSENETIQILNNIMDFVPDIKWFSVYDSSNYRKKREEKKKEVEEYNFNENERNMFTDYIEKNPGKDSPEELAKYALTYLIREYENHDIKNQNSNDDKYKKIIESLKDFSSLLKRGNMKSSTAYEEVPNKVFLLLEKYNEDDEVARQVFDTLSDVLEKIKRQRRDKQMQKDGDMRISLAPLELHKSQHHNEE